MSNSGLLKELSSAEKNNVVPLWHNRILQTYQLIVAGGIVLLIQVSFSLEPLFDPVGGVIIIGGLTVFFAIAFNWKLIEIEKILTKP